MDDADKAADLEEARTASLMAKIASDLKMVNTDIYCEDCEQEIPWRGARLCLTQQDVSGARKAMTGSLKA